MRIATVPFTPSTSRITSGWFSRMGMQSVILTVPPAVVKSVSRTSVSSLYLREVEITGSAGSSCQ